MNFYDVRTNKICISAVYKSISTLDPSEVSKYKRDHAYRMLYAVGPDIDTYKYSGLKVVKYYRNGFYSKVKVYVKNKLALVNYYDTSGKVLKQEIVRKKICPPLNLIY